MRLDYNHSNLGAISNKRFLSVGVDQTIPSLYRRDISEIYQSNSGVVANGDISRCDNAQ